MLEVLGYFFMFKNIVRSFEIVKFENEVKLLKGWVWVKFFILWVLLDYFIFE